MLCYAVLHCVSSDYILLNGLHFQLGSHAFPSEKKYKKHAILNYEIFSPRKKIAKRASTKFKRLHISFSGSRISESRIFRIFFMMEYDPDSVTISSKNTKNIFFNEFIVLS